MKINPLEFVGDLLMAEEWVKKLDAIFKDIDDCPVHCGHSPSRGGFPWLCLDVVGKTLRKFSPLCF